MVDPTADAITSVRVTAEDREHIRRVHAVFSDEHGSCCIECARDWPCDTIMLCDALDAAEARVTALERERDDLAEANENAWTNVNLQADELGAERAMLHERVAVLEGVVDLLRRWHGAWLHRQAEQAALGRDTEERAFQDILDAIDEAWRQEYRAEEELAAALAALDGQQDSVGEDEG